MIKGKTIYTPKGAAYEYGHIGCNFYTGCPHGCEYCYLKRGAPSKQLGGTEVRLKKCFHDADHAISVFRKEIELHLEECRKEGIFFSFTTDPLIPQTRELTKRAIIEAIERGVFVFLLTKDAGFVKDPAFWTGLADNNWKFAFTRIGFTLTGRDDMEPHAYSNAMRINAMRKLCENNFYTFASVEPVIDWDSSEKVIHDSIEWCEHYLIGLRSGVRKDYYDPDGSFIRLKSIVDFITSSGKNVSLKQSVINLISHCKSVRRTELEQLVSKTVDMNRFSVNNPFK